jgi:hypothetical protein
LGATDIGIDDAIHNDQISVCDTNSDNVVTLDEAQAFRQRVAEKIASLEKGKANGSKSEAAHEATVTSTAARQAANSPPPGLIHY